MLRKSKKQPQTVAEKVSKLLAHPNESDSADNVLKQMLYQTKEKTNKAKCASKINLRP